MDQDDNNAEQLYIRAINTLEFTGWCKFDILNEIERAAAKKTSSVRRLYRMNSTTRPILPHAIADSNVELKKVGPPNKFTMPIFATELIKHTGFSYIAMSYDSMSDVISNDIKQGNLPLYYEHMNPFTPTHLYVDFECYKKHNPNIDIENITTNFISELKGFFKLTGVVAKKNQVECRALESRYDDKFSCHYLFYIENKTFKDNYNCGAFMRLFCMWIMKKYGTEISCNPFFFLDREGKNYVFFADMAVYTKGRVFRTAYSTKFKSRNSPLLSTSQWADAKWTPSKTLIYPPYNKDVFMEMLAQNVSNIEELIVCKEYNGSPAFSTTDKPYSCGKRKRAPGMYEEFVKKGMPGEPISLICFSIIREFLGEQHFINFISHDSEKRFVVISAPKNHNCLIKKKLLNDDKASHHQNHIYFVVHYLKGIFIQRCHNKICEDSLMVVEYKISKKMMDRIYDYFQIERIVDYTGHEFVNEFLEIIKFIGF